MYAYFYLEYAGISEPWNRSDVCNVIAAGDDVTFFVHPEYVDRVYRAIYELTARSKT